MRKLIKLRHPVLHIKVRHTLRLNRIAQAHVRIDLHALLGVEAHLFVRRSSLVQVARPLHRLHKRRKLHYLRADGRVKHPSRPDRNLRSAALRSAQHHLHTDMSRADPRHRHDVVEEQRSHDQHQQEPCSQLQPSLQHPRSFTIKPTTTTVTCRHHIAKERHRVLLLQRSQTMARYPTAVMASRVAPLYRATSLGWFIRGNAITINLYPRTEIKSVRRNLRDCIARRLAACIFGLTTSLSIMRKIPRAYWSEVPWTSIELGVAL